MYAWEKLDFFIVDSNQNYYVEDNEKNIIQKFDKYGNFVVGYSFGIPIVGIRMEDDIVHVLTKNKKEYALEQKKIIYLNISDENNEKWYSYMDTDEYDKYYIFHRKISKVLDNENEEVIELKAPVLPIPTRWYCYCISFCLFTMFMKWLFSLKKKLPVYFK